MCVNVSFNGAYLGERPQAVQSVTFPDSALRHGRSNPLFVHYFLLPDLCPVQTQIMSNSYARMPLQRKVSLTLISAIGGFCVLSFLIIERVITPAFDDLEMSAARTDLIRAERAIQNDLETLSKVTLDWSAWDDMYNFVEGTNPAFEKSNLNHSSLVNLDLDMLVVHSAKNEYVWGRLLIDEREVDISYLGVLEDDQLTQIEDAETSWLGVVQTRLGSMMISAQPILRSDDSGPVAGSVIMAQFLDDDGLAGLSERTEVRMNWAPIAEFEEHVGHAHDEIVEGEVHIVAQGNVIASHKTIDDIYGRPVVMLTTYTARSITALGHQTTAAAMLFLISAGLLATVLMWFVLRRTILSPIEQLTDHMDEIRESGDLSKALTVHSQDEVGTLATQFNSLTEELDDTRKALLFQSFKAGKADTAAEVLHNIRNAMTPLINGVDRLAKVFRSTDGLRIGEAAEQLRDPDVDRGRAEKLVDYLEASFEHVRRTHDDAADDVEIVLSQARQVEAILADQEKFANAQPVTESFLVDEVLSEAAHIIPKDVAAEIEVDLNDCKQGIRVEAHRIGLVQVLGNLILNAYESIQRFGQDEGRIALSADADIFEERAMVRLTVSDNGCGFDADTGDRIFQRGYTSKSDSELTGLGLHWCANAVAGMGGRIFAQSDGDGQGAEFHVLLPAATGGTA